MIRHEVDDDLDAVVVSDLYELFELRHTPEKRVGFLEITRPKTMVRCTIVWMKFEDVLHRRRYPKGRYSQLSQIAVLNFIDDPLPVSPTVLLQIRTVATVEIATWVVRRITIFESISDDLIDHVVGVVDRAIAACRRGCFGSGNER